MLIAEKDLPQDLNNESAVEAAYSAEMAEVASKLQRGLPTLIECDKDLAPFLFINLRTRLKAVNLRCVYLDGRPRQEESETPGMASLGLIGTMISQLRDAVRGAIERRVVVLPHLDLLTTSQGGLTAEAREVIPLLYENPELVWLGFKDPSFPLPRVIENLFPHRISLVGLRRDRLRYLITRRESRKFGREFNPWNLYKHVSGVNAVRLRRLLSTLEGEDYPANPVHAYRQLRQATLGGSLEVPNISFDRDIGGYTRVKERLRSEILDLLTRKETLTSEEQIKSIEELIPKGMIFWGPPGTGKTLFAKAIASEIGAAVTVVSGPELKSKWVGESEDNLRQIFHKARQSAPSIIIFDELDSFASARGTYSGSGVEHSMVNQLLTEMDGFHREEMVFVVGTTNLVEILDPALLRPGRFEFHLYIPYPDQDARREILRIYNRKMGLKMSEETLESTVKRTEDRVPGTASGTFFSGDHLNALCRGLARRRLRAARQDETTAKDVEDTLMDWVDRVKLTPQEERVVATHEAGHAVVSLFTPQARPVERIALTEGMYGTLGLVQMKAHENRFSMTRGQMMAYLSVAFGGMEAELMLLGDDPSIGCEADLQSATSLARSMVEIYGMGGDRVSPLWCQSNDRTGNRVPHLSQAKLEALDQRIDELLNEARQKARTIIHEQWALVESLRDLLIDKKVIEAKTFKELVATKAIAPEQQ